MASRPLIRESLTLLNIAGIYPHENNIYSKIKFIFANIIVAGMFLEVLVKTIYEWKGFTSIQGLVVSLGLYQVVFKMSIMAINRNRIGNILRSIDKFFPKDGYYSQKLQKEIEIAHYFARVYMKTMFGVYTIFGILYFGRPFFITTRSLPVDTYHPIDPSKSPDYEIMYFLQYILMFVVVSPLMGFDMLFVSLVVNIMCELKVLKYSFANLMHENKGNGIVDSDRNWSKLKQLIAHHNLILRCIKRLNQVYAIVLLNVFLSHTICICVGLLSIIASGFPENLEMAPTYILYVIFHSGQLFFYCIGGTLLMNENGEVANAMYDCEWWSETHPKFRRACIMVIQRAHRVEKLTAGGVFTLDLENFTEILRTALSFFTLVKAVYGEK